MPVAKKKKSFLSFDWFYQPVKPVVELLELPVVEMPELVALEVRFDSIPVDYLSHTCPVCHEVCALRPRAKAPCVIMKCETCGEVWTTVKKDFIGALMERQADVRLRFLTGVS